MSVRALSNTGRFDLFRTARDIPDLRLILVEVGYVFIAFQRPSGNGGHTNLLGGYSVTDFVPQPLTFDARLTPIHT